ncbi:MAG: hypothetical protein KGZ87_02410 [Bacteroidetes bacterium]|nr:hypothetical protein [Bacteroidota bacterium]
MTIVPEFVERIPQIIEEGKIYISTSVNTAIHLCPCGCKTEIVTPIDPSEWYFTYNGETISLYPSVGVWGAVCKSHYWIKKNQIEWSRTYSKQEIEEVRTQETIENQKYYDYLKSEKNNKKRISWFRRLLKLFDIY